MFRTLSIALVMACASPAMAQTCKITRTADGLTTLASVLIGGTTASNLTLDTGPITADVRIGKDAKAKGYSVGKGERGSLYIFLSGKSVENADWRNPGTIATEQTGLGVEWPQLLLKGKPVDKVRLTISTGNTSDFWTISLPKDKKRYGRAILSYFDTVASHGFDDLSYGEDEYDAMDIWADWQTALGKREPLVVTFSEPDTKAEIATIAFTQMTAETAQARLVADVNALRKAVAEKRCETR